MIWYIKKISLERRNIGAIFIEEIGIGGVFKHLDLQEMECYLLDSGTHDIYLWYGLESTYQSRCLCVRVCHYYINELYKLNSENKDDDTLHTQLPNNNNSQSTNEEGNILLKRPLTVPNNLLNIIYLESRFETDDFKDFFLYWNHSIDNLDSSDDNNKTRFCQYFDPKNITLENEANDDLYHPNGLLKDTNITPVKYSETHVYKYHLRTEQQQQDDMNKEKEDFRKLQLKHPHSNINSNSSTSTSTSQLPTLDDPTINIDNNNHLLHSENSSFSSDIKHDTNHNNTKVPEFVLQRRRLKSLTTNNTPTSEVLSLSPQSLPLPSPSSTITNFNDGVGNNNTAPSSSSIG